MHRLNRRQVIATALACPVAGTARAQDYPAKPVRMIVPFPPGGPTDIVARPTALLLGHALGQQIFVDNRGGAGGSIGADFVAKAAPDGYTLLMGTVGTNAINGALYPRLPHDPIEDFTPIASVASAPVAIVVHPDAGFATLASLVAMAKAAPDAIQYGSAGAGTPGHLAGAMFCSTAGIGMQHIPYKGSAPAITDLLGGQIKVMFDPLQSVLPNVAAGKLKALALTSRQRSPLLPAVPTVSGSGWPHFESTAWWAVFAPARLPAGITTRLRTALEKIVRSDDYRSKLGNVGVQPLSVPLAEFQKSETAKWSVAVRNAGIALE
ncbi:Bug family tripartite tricarboxylate transporter substrate binding protein [Verminephrobacter eiseniae]|uniref:Bug family tripartite tricarboxylate transporter substrate binding protein n=1 Tax=Verminephrobacter eiseniae TaxID=364317 RepID=UPI002237B2CF|nr:tripartite tricarboxylate transporter substrate binding protein [Verminephrobacter eiseniae]MCW5232797.1 tripartite tricarboxylate transporter substrate binding protein [Verminephrobacter eiseniae]MCW5295639.1 tripartite tricarboxylate transporter substrate binding protein [Verminephrobacter eiseniae]MCW8184767.1 tripartite tricarboxylate transporter substrate binding protein [Verminephrobacter eiseniae]MCW8221757.1 tripartite tricarboxylate transporter substrate binding protein [Verminephro